MNSNPNPHTLVIKPHPPFLQVSSNSMVSVQFIYVNYSSLYGVTLGRLPQVNRLQCLVSINGNHVFAYGKPELEVLLVHTDSHLTLFKEHCGHHPFVSPQRFSISEDIKIQLLKLKFIYQFFLESWKKIGLRNLGFPRETPWRKF